MLPLYSDTQIEIMVPFINNSQNILVGKADTVKNEIEMMDPLT